MSPSLAGRLCHSRTRHPAAAALIAAIGAVGLGAALADAQCVTYTMTQTAGSIVPGTADSNDHCDDCTVLIALPFPVTFFGATYNSVNAGSNGFLDFTTSHSGLYSNGCLPDASGFGPAIFPHWDDLRTDTVYPGMGIFTSTSGTAPNRIFNIEWRTVYYANSAQTANFEVRFYEGLDGFDLVYGNDDLNASSATIGVQSTGTGPFTQFSCNTASTASGMVLHFDCIPPVVPTGLAAANPSTVGQNSATLFTVAVTPAANPTSSGLAVTADFTTIGGSASQAFHDDGTHGDATAGDHTFSLSYVVPMTAAVGSKSIPFTVSDAEGRSSDGTIFLNVTPPCSGPDVTVFDLIDVANYGASGNISAFAVGTNACNPGCQPVSWIASTNQHPVVAQNMYRLMNGRFEQVGQSWLKHTFASTNSGGCGSCQQPPNGGAQLGVGCSDAYGSGLNGSQGGLGPRSQVNATTGAYPYPFTAPAVTDTTIDRRLQVYTTDVTPAQNPGARYFVECHYVTADDAAVNNGLNNATYREVTASTLLNSSPSFASGSHWRSPGIQAWKDADAAVTLLPADYDVGGITARFLVAAKATDNGNGTWHYEYAIQNLNSDRSGGSFTVPTPAGVAISNIGFHAPFSHSGEPYSNAPWTSAHSGGVLTFATDNYAANANANALRWGTLYTFRFDASTAPSTGSVSIGLFKPGSPSSLAVSGIPVPSAACAPDFNQNGTLEVADIFAFLNAWFSGDPRADFNGINGLEVADIFAFLNAWFAGC
ncbi:MAG TPA: GC-type dockerin domain-anchored protein [Phycisphaerales bacterium]|nr:GC-type dockerin domain-anchored protein [Phycisphaerales bacterium]